MNKLDWIWPIRPSSFEYSRHKSSTQYPSFGGLFSSINFSVENGSFVLAEFYVSVGFVMVQSPRPNMKLYA